MTKNRKQQEIVYFSFLFSTKIVKPQFKAASIVNEAYFVEQ